MQRFIQHFDLLQKASIPDNISYHSFKECTSYAHISVSPLFILHSWASSLLLSYPHNSHLFPLQTLPVYNYFKDAHKLAKELKTTFSNDPEKMSELRKLEQVAEHNSVALNLISRLGGLDSSLNVSLELNHHPYFATVVVKRS